MLPHFQAALRALAAAVLEPKHAELRSAVPVGFLAKATPAADAARRARALYSHHVRPRLEAEAVAALERLPWAAKPLEEAMAILQDSASHLAMHSFEIMRELAGEERRKAGYSRAASSRSHEDIVLLFADSMTHMMDRCGVGMDREDGQDAEIEQLRAQRHARERAVQGHDEL